MNANQFINKWCPEDKEEEMRADIDMLIKDAQEEKEAWLFMEQKDKYLTDE